MSLNRFMHPKNPFKKKRPNFKKLADKYPYFAEVSERKKGEENKVEINFKEPRCQYALSKALMKEYFDLELSLPLDRLIPTIPLRVNYLLWIEEILSTTYGNQQAVRGLDIGTGASCIYPLLGAKVFKWKFVSTEIDSTNFDYAVRNVADNDLESAIQVLKVKEACILAGALAELTDQTFDFVMSNPPFFESSDEAYGFTNTRDIDKRTLPVSASTASRVESVRRGGEVLFVYQLIHESLESKDRIKIYSSMLGKKQSLKPIKRLLRNLKVPKWSVYELCQGRVMRWGIAWSFDPQVVFPRSPFRQKRLQLRPPLTWVVPEEVRCLDIYDRAHLCERLKQLFKELQIHCLEQKIKGNAQDRSLVITARSDTWSNQRRKRREGLQKSSTALDSGSAQSSPEKPPSREQLVAAPEASGIPPSDKCLFPVKRKITDAETFVAGPLDQEDSEPSAKRKIADAETFVAGPLDQEDSEPSAKRKIADAETFVAGPLDQEDSEPPAKRKIADAETFVASPLDQEDSEPSAKRPKLESPESSEPCSFSASLLHDESDFDDSDDSDDEECTSPSKTPAPSHLVKARLFLRSADDLLTVEMHWISGTNREVMNQIFQFVKNRVK